MEREKENRKESGAEKLFHFRPATFTAIFLCLGIFFAYLIALTGVSAWWLLLASPCVITPFFFRHDKLFIFAMLSLTLACFVGFLSFSLQIADFCKTKKFHGELYPVKGEICSVTKTQWGCEVLLQDLTIGSREEKGKLVAYLPASFAEELQPANVIVVEGKVRTQTEFFNEYGFRANAMESDIRYVMRAETCSVQERPFKLFAFLRTRLKNAVYAGMDETSASVTLALLTGDDSGVGEGLLENVRRGGIAHVFAVSGLHVGVLFAFSKRVVEIIPFCRRRKWLRFLLSTTTLLFYGGICGYSPSVVRAITMCLCLYLASLIGCFNDFLDFLGASAIVVLLGSPVALFTAGFQLSFSACLGIGLTERPIRKGLQRLVSKVEFLFTGRSEETLPRKLRNQSPPTVYQRVRRTCLSFLSLTLSAQLGTALVSLALFGYLSGWSVILNMLFVPLVSAGFTALLVFVAIATALPIAWSAGILYVPSVVWSALLLAFQTVDYSTFVLSGVQVGASAFICYFLGLIFLSDKCNLSKLTRSILAIASFACCVLTLIMQSL